MAGGAEGGGAARRIGTDAGAASPPVGTCLLDGSTLRAAAKVGAISRAPTDDREAPGPAAELRGDGR